jgi:hypothetical protein
MTGVKYKEKILQGALLLHTREFENNLGGQISVVVEDNARAILLECAEKFAIFCLDDHN